nr:MAG TPA: hypothetical protein [Caudoviricetes sp.]DAS10664.1 MAG TPA: hypothetical protein [Caudoviricetes sp.]
MKNKELIKETLFTILTDFSVVGRLRPPIDLHKTFTRRLKECLPKEFNVIHTAIIESPHECDENHAAYFKVIDDEGKIYKAGVYYNRLGFDVSIDEVS